MTPPDDQQAELDELILTVHGADTSAVQLTTVAALYGEVFAEPPYHEGRADVENLSSGWPKLINQPNFRLILAHRTGDLVGFSFGHQLRADTSWWHGALTILPQEVTKEWSGRTFAIVELAVRQPCRRRGVGRLLHAHLTAGLPEERITLLVRPDAPAAQQAYFSWGYQRVGRVQPFPGGPVYDAMIKSLSITRTTQ